MKEFKKIIALLLVVLLVFSLAACGSSDDTNTNNGTDTNTNTGDDANTGDDTNTGDVSYDEVTVNIAGTASETNNVSKGMLKWEELVEEKSGGAVQVEVFLNATSAPALQSSSPSSPALSRLASAPCLPSLPSSPTPSTPAFRLRSTPVSMPMPGPRLSLPRIWLRKLLT